MKAAFYDGSKTHECSKSVIRLIVSIPIPKNIKHSPSTQMQVLAMIDYFYIKIKEYFLKYETLGLGKVENEIIWCNLVPYLT